MSEEPVSKLIADVGWLSPDGKYYPCEGYNAANPGSFFHQHTAKQIADWLYPGQTDDSAFSQNNAQSLLTRNGWIRIDTEELFFIHRPTQKQIDTLFDLYRLKGQRYLPTDELRRVCAWGGLKFLSKPTDDYTDLEGSCPFD